MSKIEGSLFTPKNSSGILHKSLFCFEQVGNKKAFHAHRGAEYCIIAALNPKKKLKRGGRVIFVNRLLTQQIY